MGVNSPTLSQDSAVLEGQSLNAGPGAQSWSFLNIMSPRNRTGGGWGRGTAQLSSPPRSHCPILPLQLDSQGFWWVQWGWSRGADHQHLPSLPPETLILSLPLTYYHLLPRPPPTPAHYK